MLNIWGRISSINVRKVVWCAQELGLDFQRTEAGGKFGVALGEVGPGSRGGGQRIGGGGVAADRRADPARGRRPVTG